MRVARAAFAAVMAVTILAGLGIFQPGRAQASSGCMPAGGRPVGVLVRSPGGTGFTSLEVDGDAEPYLNAATSRTVVPLRSLFSALAGPGAVSWDGSTRTASFAFRHHTLSITVPAGSTHASKVTVDGQSPNLSAFLCGGKLYANLSDVAQWMSFETRWMAPIVLVDAIGDVNDFNLATENRDAVVNASYHTILATKATPVSRVGIGASASAALSPCEAIPGGFIDIFLSPGESFHQAARATACRLVAGM